MSRKKKTKARQRKSTPGLEDEGRQPMPVMSDDGADSEAGSPSSGAISMLSGAMQDNLIIVYIKHANNYNDLTGDWMETCIVEGEYLVITDTLRASSLYFEDSRGEIDSIPKAISWKELRCKLKDFPRRIELVFFEEPAPLAHQYCRAFFLCVGFLTGIVLGILPIFPQFRHLNVPFNSLMLLIMEMTHELLGTPFAPKASPFYFLRKYHPRYFKQFVTRH